MPEWWGRLARPMGWNADRGKNTKFAAERIGLTIRVAAVIVLMASLIPRLAQAAFLNRSTDSSQDLSQGSVLASYSVTRDGATYRATPEGDGTTYTGTLKQVMESAARKLNAGGGGTITFASGLFDFGSDKFVGSKLSNIAFQGQGMDLTVLQNMSVALADTEPFDMHDSNRITIRDMTVTAGGLPRSSSDAIDFDGGNDVLIQRVKIAGSRGRGIVFDGKDLRNGIPRTADRNAVRDCVITAVPADGIELLASSENHVERCTVTNVGGHGIQITKASATANQPNKKSNRNTLSTNSIENAGQDGINLTGGDGNEILRNTVLNSSDDVLGRDGVRIGSSNSITCDSNVVDGNTVGDNQVLPTQRYGLSIGSSLCHGTLVGENAFFGNRLGTILDLGTATQYATLPVDSEPPTSPSNLAANGVESNRVELSWTASTDNVGVTGYDVFRDGTPLVTLGAVTAHLDTSVSPSTNYQYQVRARDGAGNLSPLSDTAFATTPAPAGAVFSDGFESGNFSQWTTNAGLVAQQEEIFAGAWAARGSTANVATWAYRQLGATYTELFYRIRFKVLTQGSTSNVNVLKFRTSTGASILGLYRSSNGNLGYRNDVAGVSTASSTPVRVGVWHDLQVRVVVNGTFSTTETWLNGIRIASLSKAENFGTTPIGRIQIGENSTGRTYDIAVDEVVADSKFIA
jgi:parallel beta-helix repeat protein